MGRSENSFERLIKSVISGNSEKAVTLTREMLAKGVKPIEIINNGLSKGMIAVGERFARGEIFLIHMMLSANAMDSAIKVLEPILLEAKEKISTKGTVVIGTVQGDIHDIGKNVVVMMLKAEGFRVIDLGKDVPIDAFLKSAEENNADIIAMSALLTTTMTYMKELLEIMRNLGLRDKYKVMLGGSPVTEEYARGIGADGYGKNAIDAVRVAGELVTSKQ